MPSILQSKHISNKSPVPICDKNLNIVVAMSDINKNKKFTVTPVPISDKNINKVVAISDFNKNKTIHCEPSIKLMPCLCFCRHAMFLHIKTLIYVNHPQTVKYIIVLRNEIIRNENTYLGFSGQFFLK